MRGFSIDLRTGSLSSLRSLPAVARAAVIGNFDGVHLGHQAIIRELRTAAEARGLPATAIFFEPQTREFFSPPDLSRRLSALRDKASLLGECGIEHAICLHFNEALSKASPADFFGCLLDDLRLRHVLVGSDFRFGCGRSGDINVLRRLCEPTATVQVMEDYCLDGKRVSSTAIRAAFQAGDLARVNRLLGRPLRIAGRVGSGSGRGRGLGFPTANVRTCPKQLALVGIFAAQVSGVGGGTHPAVVYWGSRPVYGGGTPVLEAHLLDFQGDLYGRRLQVELLHRLRGDQGFDDERALQAQMRKDARMARDCLRQA